MSELLDRLNQMSVPPLALAGDGLDQLGPQNFDVCVKFFCGVPMPAAHQRVGVWPATGERHGRSGR